MLAYWHWRILACAQSAFLLVQSIAMHAIGLAKEGRNEANQTGVDARVLVHVVGVCGVSSTRATRESTGMWNSGPISLRASGPTLVVAFLQADQAFQATREYRTNGLALVCRSCGRCCGVSSARFHAMPVSTLPVCGHYGYNALKATWPYLGSAFGPSTTPLLLAWRPQAQFGYGFRGTWSPSPRRCVPLESASSHPSFRLVASGHASVRLLVLACFVVCSCAVAAAVIKQGGSKAQKSSLAEGGRAIDGRLRVCVWCFCSMANGEWSVLGQCQRPAAEEALDRPPAVTTTTVMPCVVASCRRCVRCKQCAIALRSPVSTLCALAWRPRVSFRSSNNRRFNCQGEEQAASASTATGRLNGQSSRQGFVSSMAMAMASRALKPRSKGQFAVEAGNASEQYRCATTTASAIQASAKSSMSMRMRAMSSGHQPGRQARPITECCAYAGY
jgi:hypothetical protein